VGIGDFNKDGLEDIFFGGSMVSSALYLNKGALKFEDVTEKSGVKTNQWITGVSVVDINQDGWQDIYLSVSGYAKPENRQNLLFINQGNEVKQRFTEEAEKYGLADTSQVTHTAFFDYDKDGDLDAIMILNPTDYKLNNVNTIRKKKVNGEASSTDRLYRNNGDGTFTNVSQEAGILIEGYSLSLNVSDLNGDNWPDIYITNDFLSNDILYINNQDGTFTNRAAEMMKHTSFASMGVDIADINNDAKPDIYVADMYPEDNYRQKMIMSAGSYDRFNYMLKAGYEAQYSRNTLQLNNGNNTFSEIGQLAGLHQTDWSWSVLFADYDNDGFRDLFVTNGFRRDLGSLDYINYGRNNPFGSQEAVKERLLENIIKQPGAKISNYIFRNHDGLTFENKTEEWGLKEDSYSHGAAYADLDLDGDLDLVINNVSQEAYIVENQQDKKGKKHFISLKLEGIKPNLNALGTKINLYFGEEVLSYEHTPYRGYESTLGQNIHFGLGEKGRIDKLEIIWNNDRLQMILNPPIDTLLKVQYQPSADLIPIKEIRKDPLFYEMITEGTGLGYIHKEDGLVDFKIQSLLPHQYSLQGPCIAVADINGDGFEDFYLGGSAKSSGMFFIQNAQGKFKQVALNQDIEKEDTNAIFLDVDEDGDQDLFVVSGGMTFKNQKEDYADRLYFNDGKGDFQKVNELLPENFVSGNSTALSKSGDLFLGGRFTPAKYPDKPKSLFLSQSENGKFKNKFPELFANTFEEEMICDAIFTDYDNDGKEDLMTVGEWSPVRFYKKENDKLVKQVIPELEQSNGWWNCIEAGDFDKDGDTDYLLGNLGLNTNNKASLRQPFKQYVADFDMNGSKDPILTHYIDNEEVTVATRDQIIGQIPKVKAIFTNYDKFAKVNFSEFMDLTKFEKSEENIAYNFANSYLENLGDGKFDLRPLPIELQTAPIQDFLVKDFNGDGNLDALVVGNSYATEVNIGRYDAFTGAYMEGDGKGNFKIQNGVESGFNADKDARFIEIIKTANGDELILVGNNSDVLQSFRIMK